MLYKYLGEASEPNSNVMRPRASCLRNGLFRITQPALLNDKTSEFRAAVYFNKFAPADYEWAREEERKFQVDPSYTPSKEELEQLFLRPIGVRYGEAMPHLWAGHEKYRSMEEFDRAQIEEIAGRINRTVVGIASALLGVLSLCEDPADKLMWTHYAAEGRGLAIGFDETHPFFASAGLKPVSYDIADRASITYFKGTVRINGRWVLPDGDGRRWQELIVNHREVRKMFEKFVYAKEANWFYEREQRVVVPLSQRDSEGDPNVLFHPSLDPEVAALVEPFLPRHPLVCLKRIPFEAFREVLLGYETSATSEQGVRELLQQNPDLRHVSLKRVRVSVFGDLTLHPCD